MNTLQQISIILTHRPELDSFGHVLGASFEVNFAYTVLLKLGKFTAGRMANWVDQEKVRVIPPLLEGSNFDAKCFSATLDGFEQRVVQRISALNRVAIFWAISASIVAMFFLFYLPYDAHDPVPLSKGLAWGAFLLGATPTGVILWLILQIAAKRHMLKYSKSFDHLLKARRTENKAAIKKLSERLIKQLKKDRHNTSGAH